ncbi:hypothetical protein GGR32_000085 [Mesonia hippocampi]|uniref:Secretion system C-terminal sorting domain-containing protein n=1 Tax=Mesonia hippocampi TaxID=1628250 RepID=A0A840EMF2_9FLAO|nr:T9SS type A sorting domain-containing protein [Mesonia hippocampi]MBB4117813.1 hypothetical protein [Mesonia hippocampi]
MKRITLFMASFFTITSFAQTFTEVVDGVSRDFFYSSSSVGDFDGDGDADLVICGAVDPENSGEFANTTICAVYENVNGTLQENTDYALSNGIHLGDVKFIDVNQDGLLDLVLTGLSYLDIVNYKNYIYINTGSSYQLQETIQGKIMGSIAVADYNHNGLQDYVINGLYFDQAANKVTNKVDLYTNANGTFTKSFLVPGSQMGDVQIADFNNDMELDVAVMGFDTDTGNRILNVYMNDGQGNLIEKQNFTGISGGTIAVADFNVDGYLDFVTHGVEGENLYSLKVYLNNQDETFTETEIPNEGIGVSNGSKSIAAGDFNNDGYYDFVLMGDDANYNSAVKIFTYNSATGGFDKYTNPTEIINAGGPSSLNVIDYNSDNKLDLLVSGFTDVNGEYLTITRLYENADTTTTNQAPNAPSNLHAETIGNRIDFSWDLATDDKTPSEALQYEIKVGTTDGGAELAQYVVTTPFWYLTFDELPEDIYWTVRSIDASQAKSGFAPTSGVLSTTNYTKTPALAIYPNPTRAHFYVTEAAQRISIYTTSGQLVQSLENVYENTPINTSALTTGVYIVQIKTLTNKTQTKKLIIQK